MDEDTSKKGLAKLNDMPLAEKRAALIKCCGSGRWVETMIQSGAFSDTASLRQSAKKAFDNLAETDWLEAFLHHPKIGDIESLRRKFASAKSWSAGEQAGAGGAREETLRELQRWNLEYERKFGFIFIVFATGKSAEEMLSILKARYGGTRDSELKTAAAEQVKISDLRIDKLLLELGDG